MSAKKTAEKKKDSSKETMIAEISLQLSTALVKLKETLGDKKFEKRIRKAAKLLTDGIKHAATKKAPVKKVPAKKTPAKKAPLKKATKAPVKKAQAAADKK